MKRVVFLVIIALLIIPVVSSQVSIGQQRYLSSEDNLQAISNLSPYSTGGLGFDNRYEGVKGSPMLMDSLLPSLMMIKGQKYYIELSADLDVVNNYLVYLHPKTKKKFSVPLDVIEEVIISRDGEDYFFRPTIGLKFEKELREPRFFQVLTEGKYELIKVATKNFVQADYKNAYSADRRYDEYVPSNKYYLKGPDSIYHQVQLNRKSLSKIYPVSREVLQKAPAENSFADKEEMIVDLIGRM